MILLLLLLFAAASIDADDDDYTMGDNITAWGEKQQQKIIAFCEFNLIL